MTGMSFEWVEVVVMVKANAKAKLKATDSSHVTLLSSAIGGVARLLFSK